MKDLQFLPGEFLTLEISVIYNEVCSKTNGVTTAAFIYHFDRYPHIWG